MELIEGVGENSSPPRSFSSVNNYDLKTDVYNRLVETGNEDVVGNPEFRDQLSAHFNRLPASYLLDVNMDRVEVLVEHMKLLELAKDPVNRPSFHVRFLETKVDGDEDQLHSSPSSSKTSLDADSCHAESNSRQVVSCHIHEVIFSTVHKPKLLSQLSALLSDIGLNIREAHVFSTTDGYSLDVFVVDGWEDTDSLHEALAKAIVDSKGSWNGSSHSQALAAEMKPRSWEIDRRLLKMGEKIASGSCGDLYHGVYLGQDVAIKILRDEHLNEASEGEFAREVSIIREVQHKNVVRFIGACTWSPSCIVTEFMHGGSLFNYLHKSKRILKLSRLLKFAVDVCKGMEYLHQNNIIHRDLRTPNLLMDTNKVVKVAGFDVARFLNQEGVMTAEIGSYRCMAPEVMNYVPYGQKADIFSFAIVLWELITAKVPYDNMTPLQVAQGVRQGLRPELPEDMHPKLLDIMQRCWDNDPCSRPPFSALQLELAELLEEIKAKMAAHKARIDAMFEATDDVNKELEKAPDVSDINIRDLQNSWALVIKTSQHEIHDPDLETAFSELCTCLTDSLDWVDFCIKQDMTTMGHRRILTLYKWMKQIYDLNEGFGIYFTDLSSGKEHANNYILENQPAADQPPAEDQPDAANEAEENNNFSSSSNGSEKEGNCNTSVSHGSSTSSSDSGSSSSGMRFELCMSIDVITSYLTSDNSKCFFLG